MTTKKTKMNEYVRMLQASTDRPMMLPRAQTACSQTFWCGDSSSCRNNGTAPACSNTRALSKYISLSMPLQLLRNTQNEHMGEAGSIPRRYRYCNSQGYCEIYKKNLVDSHWVSSFDWNHRGWLMDLHCGLSPRGDRSPCPTLERSTELYNGI